MIQHDGFTFAGMAGPFVFGHPDQPVQLVSAPGAYGASMLIGPIHGRQVSCRYTLFGIPNYAALRNIIDQMASVQGRLTGDVIRDGPTAEIVRNATFMGFIPQGEPRYSAGGNAGWVQTGELVWYQRQV